jgi:hypothetical protein
MWRSVIPVSRKKRQNKQYGDWLRVTLTRWKGQGDQRHRWSEGGNLGSGKFGRSSESGKWSLVQDYARPPATSVKMNYYTDSELIDDGTRPAKPSRKSREERLGKPKALDFEVEEDEERLEKEERGEAT